MTATSFAINCSFLVLTSTAVCMKQMMALDVSTILLTVIIRFNLYGISQPEIITSEGYHIQLLCTQNG
jgi:hypothetical protein